MTPAPDGTGRPSGSRAGFWLSAVGGWAVIGYGFRGLFIHHVDTRPANLARFVIGGALVHDLIVAPLLLMAGVVVSRATPAHVRAIVQSALIVSGCLVLFSYPLVRGYAHALHNPTSLPHNYTANLAIALGAVWGLVAVVIVVRALRRSRAGWGGTQPARDER